MRKTWSDGTVHNRKFKSEEELIGAVEGLVGKTRWTAEWRGREEKKTKGAIRFRGDGGANLVTGNIISPDVPRPVLVDPGVTVKDNLIGG